jgi:hypothetical protein
VSYTATFHISVLLSRGFHGCCFCVLVRVNFRCSAASLPELAGQHEDTEEYFFVSFNT